jgi:hypothetical protein
MTTTGEHMNTMNDTRRTGFEGKLAAYMAATGAVGTFLTSDSEAAVVVNNSVVPFGINQEVNIDFNSDGQTDFQIDHDRVDLSGAQLDYLQIDKNDINGAANPLDFDPGPDTVFAATPFTDGVTPRNDANEAAYVIDGPQGSYPAALTAGTSVGPPSTFDFQEGSNFQGSGKDIRANRLIDEDATQIDQVLGGQPASGVQVPFSGPNFLGLGGEVRYLGVRMDLNNADALNYGWIGIQITDEAAATGNVVGWGYQTTPGAPIGAGAPEPGSIMIAAISGLLLAGRTLARRLFGR